MTASRWAELWLRTGEHLILTGVSMGIAIAIGIPVGVFAFRNPRLRATVVGLIGILQTIPSLAMLALLLVILRQIGVVPAIIALSLYALLPIVRNTIAGFENVPREVREAAEGIGMSRRQQMLIVELPLAAPILFAGIRTAAVVGVGIATLSAFIGAGGLGQFINRGLALARYELILLGAIPAAVLALLVDGTLGATAWGLEPRRRRERGTWKAKLRPVAIAAPLVLVVLGLLAARLGDPRGVSGAGAPVRIGSKNFTEQLILAELLGQLLRARTDLEVESHTNLGGTMICHEALVKGGIDLYVEYTGTALTAILDLPIPEDTGDVRGIVAREYRERFELTWLEPLGFDNTYALAVRESDARERGWETISDLARQAPELRAGFTAEFSERPDGYPGLRREYDLRFAEVVDLDPALMYGALARGEVDVIAAFATDGRIVAYELKTLADDRSYFPPYEAAPVVRSEALERHSELGNTLSLLAGRIDTATMRRLNAEVDEKKRSPASVVRGFLREQGLTER